MNKTTILNHNQFNLTIQRLCRQLIENHGDFSDTVIIGLQPRGIYLSLRITKVLQEILKTENIASGALDITFFRDDFRRTEQPLKASATKIDFIIENKKVVLIDDVLFTGRTIRAGMDAMLSFGRPKMVELLVLIDRRFSRQLPIQPDYVGRWVDSISSEKVAVNWKETEGEDQVLLYTSKTKNE
jgi:pyrimidine operon attenuation protein / uracil phosphoribosyltransferase